jgi:ElaB/YqjD/DUF883 family membrane-anchored ribosome-binding protein
MNTGENASRDASGPGQRSTAGHQVCNYDGSKDKLLADLKMVVADAEKLIKEAAASSAEGFATLRTRFETMLSETRARIDRARAAVGEKTKHATDTTHAYVKENPWKSAGVFAAAGVMLGIFLRRRRQ